MSKLLNLHCVRLVLTVAVAALTLVSCEKYVPTDSADGTNGNLRVTVFEIEKTAFASLTRTSVAEACTRLNFAVYAPDGTRVKQVNQTSDGSDFGAASFQLDEGDYQLVVVGHSASGNPAMTNPAKIQFTNATGYTDTFLFCGNVSVGDDAVNIDVSLDRIVALCRFVVDDDYPEDVARMQFYYTGGSGAFDAATGLGSVNSKQTVTCSVADGRRQFDLYTFLHEQEGNVSLRATALDANGGELYSREFEVPMERNHITWLSGPFFGGGGGASATAVAAVSVDTAWAGESHETF